jgi:tagatose 1,6-diphosphate aldolase GatY/KbaY
MLTDLRAILAAAQVGGYAVGAFNVYNLEGVLAVVGAAEAAGSPAILQLHPGALREGGVALVATCLAAARQAAVPVAVHLDHSPTHEAMRVALAAGVGSLMADGAGRPYEENVAFTATAVALAGDALVEGELGLLSGAEDGLEIAARDAKMTDPAQVPGFVAATGIEALAVCIGNVHGPYAGEPRLDFARLAAIRAATGLPLVLHGASGLPAAAITRAIGLGVCKFNVNTEVRGAYLATLRERLTGPAPVDVPDLMRDAITAMRAVVAEKLALFGSVGRAA